MKMCKLLYVIFTTLIFSLASDHTAQAQSFGNTTVGEALTKATGTISDLKTAKGQLDLNLGIDAKIDANVNVTANGLIEKLDGLVNNLKASLKDQLATPIENLTASVRDSFAQLDSTLKSVDVIISRQRSGLAQDLGVLAAQLQTTALEFDQNFPLIGKTGAPRIFYFAFDGSQINVVPKKGGWCNLTGFGLWDNASPRVDLLDDSKDNVISSLRVKRGNSNNQISISLPGDLIEKNAGKILYVRVTPINTRGILFWKHKSELPPLFTALVVPQEFNTTIVITGHISSKIAGLKSRKLPTQGARFDNSNCGHDQDVSRRLTWSLNPNGKIVDMGFHQGEVRNGNRVGYTISGNDSIVISGNIDSPTCIMVKIPPFGPEIAKLQHSTIWSADFTPTEEYPGFDERIATNNSPPLLLSGIPQTSIQIPMSAQSNDNVMWFDVTFLDGKKSRTVFTSPREIVTASAARQYTFSGYTLETQYNARVTDGTSEINLKFGKLVN